jgi:hypothetical protein
MHRAVVLIPYTFILTVMPGELDVPLPDTVRRQMSIPLLDEANADLLHALPVCLEFIDDALLNDGKVFVHWCDRRPLFPPFVSNDRVGILNIFVAV